MTRQGRMDPAIFLPLALIVLLGVLLFAFWPRPAAGPAVTDREETETEAEEADGDRAEDADEDADEDAGEDAGEDADEDASEDADEGDAEDDNQQAKGGDDVADETLPVVELETSKGTIRARLFAERAPKTTENFLDLVKQDFYDGIIFHRVIKEFMVQTGDPTGTGRGGRTDKGLEPKMLRDEFHPELRHNKPGILSMANAGPNTGDTQFFITTVPTPHLDDRHAVFGEVIDGMDVVRAIENVETGAGDRPVDPPKIIEARIVSGEGADEGATGNDGP